MTNGRVTQGTMTGFTCKMGEVRQPTTETTGQVEMLLPVLLYAFFRKMRTTYT